MNREQEYNIATAAIATNPQQPVKSLYIVGCDEAGRGPLVGPVVTAACCLHFDASNKDNTHKKSLASSLPGLLSELGDSKKLSEPTRDKLFAELIKQQQQQTASKKEQSQHNSCVAYKIVRIEADEIDQLNILEASLYGMETAANSVIEDIVNLHREGKFGNNAEAPNENNCVVVVDGPHLPRSLRVVLPPVVVAENETKNDAKQKRAKKAPVLSPKAQKETEARTRLCKPLFTKVKFVPKGKAVIKGDAICPSISAASVLAKVERDKIMIEEIAPKLDKSFRIADNKGYPTGVHLEALEKIGPSQFHRKSYAPVAKAVEKFEQKKKKEAKTETKAGTGKVAGNKAK